MIPLTFLYDEYIDRPKLTDQKNPFKYIVPPPPFPTSGIGTKMCIANNLQADTCITENARNAHKKIVFYSIYSKNFIASHDQVIRVG